MKKILIVLAVFFITGIGCKKTLDPGGGLCACSPTTGPYLSLVIKTNTGADLLNPATSGSFKKEEIQLYSKTANGETKQISFALRPPFSYGSDKYEFYQIYSSDIALQAKSLDNVFYLKLSDSKVYEVNLSVTANKVDKLLIDKTDIPLDHLTSTPYSYVNTIFTFKQP